MTFNDWKSAYFEIRNLRNREDDPESFVSFWTKHSPFLRHFLDPQEELLITLSQHDPEQNKNSSSSSSSAPTNTGIQQFLYCLRTLLLCTSIPLKDFRREIQCQCVTDYQLHSYLVRVVCYIFDIISANESYSESNHHNKILTLCIRLLCNLVTDNEITASTVTQSIPIDSDDNDSTCCHIPLGNNNSECELPVPEDVTLLDIFLKIASSGKRQNLSDFLLVIYNCIVSLRRQLSESTSFVDRISDSPLLIANLLRYALSGSNIVLSSETKEQSLSRHGDEATSLTARILLTLAATHQKTEQLYKNAPGSRYDNISRVYPEHIILLHLFLSEISSLGPQDFHSAYSSDQIVQMSSTLSRIFAAIDTITTTEDTNEFIELVIEARSLITEIISEVITGDTDTAFKVRQIVGEGLLKSTVLQLGSLLDELAIRNQNVLSRELKILEKEQRVLVNSVRFIGNVCYQCPCNQNLLREVTVSKERTGIHILLSTTAYSQACFTLREWAVVAVRNVLENNLENQKLVEQLEAKQPIQTGALQNLGMKVSLGKNGEVSVKPISED